MLALLLSYWHSPLFLLHLNMFLVFMTWLPRVQASPDDVRRIPVYKCPYPASPDNEQYEKILNGLNGTRIVFIGDSVTRFQYVTLASYLAKGVCPGKEDEDRSREYTDLYHPRGAWDDYYRASSKVLNTNRSVETCFCEEKKTMPEYRTFTYRDNEERLIEVIFLFYETEWARPLKNFIQTATNLEPTHVVINYGHWMAESANRDCGYGTKGKARLCPRIEEACKFLNGYHSFRVIWQTTTPKWNIGDPIVDVHLHIPQACNMDPKNVLHRGLVVAAVEPVNKNRQAVFHDMMHFSPLASHAFNGVLFEMIVNGWSLIKLPS